MSKRTFATNAELSSLANLFTGHPVNERIPKRELLDRTGMSKCNLRDAASRLVTEYGIPLIAFRGKGGGYLLTNDTGKIGREVMRLNSHAREMNIRRDALNEALVRFGGDPKKFITEDDSLSAGELEDFDDLLDRDDDE